MQDAHFVLGIDVATRAAHVATLADRSGQLVWTNHRFRTTTSDLQTLWSKIPHGAIVTVVLEPTANAWVPAASWLAARDARIVLVPPEQSADLRKYYEKHQERPAGLGDLVAAAAAAPGRAAEGALVRAN